MSERLHGFQAWLVRPLFALLVLTFVVVGSPPARALPGPEEQVTPAARGLAPWERSLYKTLTYETLSNGVDLALFGLVLGGTVGTSPVFLVVNAGTAAAAYYIHEVAWAHWGPPEEDYDSVTLAGRAVVYRLVNTTRAFGVGLAFGGGDPLAATAYAIIGAIADTIVYVYNDYAWKQWFPAQPRPRVRTFDIAYPAPVH